MYECHDLSTVETLEGPTPTDGCMLALSWNCRAMLCSLSMKSGPIGTDESHLGIVTPSWKNSAPNNNTSTSSGTETWMEWTRVDGSMRAAIPWLRLSYSHIESQDAVREFMAVSGTGSLQKWPLNEIWENELKAEWSKNNITLFKTRIRDLRYRNFIGIKNEDVAGLIAKRLMPTSEMESVDCNTKFLLFPIKLSLRNPQTVSRKIWDCNTGFRTLSH